MHTSQGNSIPFINYDIEIPNEEQIRTDYKFKLPVVIKDLEHKVPYVHILGGFPHSIEFYEVYCNKHFSLPLFIIYFKIRH